VLAHMDGEIQLRGLDACMHGLKGREGKGREEEAIKRCIEN
jgi:hypothetical protein